MNLFDRHSARPWPRPRFNAALLAAIAATGLGGLQGPRPAGAQQRRRPTPIDSEGPCRPLQSTAWGGIDLMSARDAASPGKPPVHAGRLPGAPVRLHTGLRLQVWQAGAMGCHRYHRDDSPVSHGRTRFGSLP